MIKTIARRVPERVRVRPALGVPEVPKLERSETQGAADNSIAVTGPPDPHVPEKGKRRPFTAEYKYRILSEADACTGSGETVALLRREGLYSSHLSTWRRQCDQGLESVKRGRKATHNPLEDEVKQLRREKSVLEHRLKRAEVILEMPKKASEMLGIPLNSPESEGGD